MFKWRISSPPQSVFIPILACGTRHLLGEFSCRWWLRCREVLDCEQRRRRTLYPITFMACWQINVRNSVAPSYEQVGDVHALFESKASNVTNNSTHPRPSVSETRHQLARGNTSTVIECIGRTIRAQHSYVSTSPQHITRHV